jgi:hypothetical protein
MKTITVYTKANKYRPTPIATEYTVELDRNSFIGIYKNGVMGSSFRIGDQAESISIYTGTISKITDKIVQIVEYPGTLNERKYNLSLYEFCYKNYRFYAERVAAHNFEESMYI